MLMRTWLVYLAQKHIIGIPFKDKTEMYDFWLRFLLLYSPFLFPFFLGGKRKREKSSKYRVQKSYLSVPSHLKNDKGCRFYSKLTFKQQQKKWSYGERDHCFWLVNFFM